MNQPLTFRLAADSHRGMVRSGNEDAFRVFPIAGFDAAFAVADGMGGLRAGDIASGEAIRVVESSLKRLLTVPNADILAALRQALVEANDAVNALARPGASDDESTASPIEPAAPAAPDNALMGTTMVAGVVRDGFLYLAHAGDSRAYRLRNGRLERLTEDHSFVAERVRAGDMTEVEARKSRFRNMITRAIGIDANIVPELRTEPLLPGDLILVCSDGLTTMLEDHEFAPLLDYKLAPERVVAALIDAANRRGGHDNTTCLVLDADGPTSAASTSATRPPVSDVSSAMPTTSVPVAVAPATAPRGDWEPASTSGARSSTGKSSSGGRRSGGSTRRGAISPGLALLSLVGALAVLCALAIGLSTDLRGRVGRRLLGAGVPQYDPSRLDITPVIDFTELVFDPPQSFASEYLARGDRLVWAPGTGIVFATQSTGKVALLSRKGELLSNPVDLPPSATTQTGAAADEVYFTADGQGNVYVSTTKRRTIEKYGKDRRLLVKIGPEWLTRPQAIAVDEAGNLYVVDNNYIKVLTAKPRPLVPRSTSSPKPSSPKPSPPKPSPTVRP